MRTGLSALPGFPLFFVFYVFFVVKKNSLFADHAEADVEDRLPGPVGYTGAL